MREEAGRLPLTIKTVGFHRLIYMSRKDNSVNDLEVQRIKNGLDELQDNGYINFKITPDGRYETKVNVLPIIETLDALGDIPLSIPLYKEVHKKIRNKKKFINALPILLAISCIDYNSCGRDINSMSGRASASDEDMAIYSKFIGDYYDLEKPVMDHNKPYYWFRVKKEERENLNRIAEKQNPNDFAGYYLK